MAPRRSGAKAIALLCGTMTFDANGRTPICSILAKAGPGANKNNTPKQPIIFLIERPISSLL
jgi:hypothetical protein